MGVAGRPSYVRAIVVAGVRSFLHRSGRMGIIVVSSVLDFGEGSAIERRLFFGKILPAEDCDIAVGWADFDRIETAAGHLCCDRRGERAWYLAPAWRAASYEQRAAVLREDAARWLEAAWLASTGEQRRSFVALRAREVAVALDAALLKPPPEPLLRPASRTAVARRLVGRGQIVLVPRPAAKRTNEPRCPEGGRLRAASGGCVDPGWHRSARQAGCRAIKSRSRAVAH
jgi:hypothetical protein